MKNVDYDKVEVRTHNEVVVTRYVVHLDWTDTVEDVIGLLRTSLPLDATLFDIEDQENSEYGNLGTLVFEETTHRN